MHRVHGVVWIGPTCAGAQKEDDLCRAPLVGVKVRLRDSEGAVIDSIATDAKGEFMLRGPAGPYRLGAQGIGKVMRCPEIKITLPLVAAIRIELECDNGMR